MEHAEKRQFKQELYEQFARIGRCLANGHRLEILDLLAQGERTVEDLGIDTDLSTANVSQHLQVLRSARLVKVRRDGLYAFYSLADPAVFSLWQVLRTIGETHLTEVQHITDKYLTDRSQLQAICAEELYALINRNSVTVIDVRPLREYASGHIPSARSIPIEELESRLSELPKGKDIVAYCRGPYCVFADEAVLLLNRHGYRAIRLNEGLPDWDLKGLSVEI